MAINNTALTATPASIYVSTGTSAITTIHLCNYTGSAIQANIYAVPNGGIADTSTVIYSNVQITAYNTLIVSSEKMILENGDAIYADVDTVDSVTATVSSIGI